jgi:hypothetical protein
MNARIFDVRTTPRFDRLFKKLAGGHREAIEILSQAVAMLKADPYNRTRQHPIKKVGRCCAG